MSIFDLDTSEKIISIGAGVFAILGFFLGLRKIKKNSENQLEKFQSNSNENKNSGSNIGSINQTVNLSVARIPEPAQAHDDFKSDAETKRTKILFIDDDKKYRIVGILRRMGWERVALISDVQALEQTDLVDADVVCIDIQGVGLKLNTKDQGLGLASAIRRRHPLKKIIIYSAQESGERFHPALNDADYTLPKNTEPVRFEEVIFKVLRS